MAVVLVPNPRSGDATSAHPADLAGALSPLGDVRILDSLLSPETDVMTELPRAVHDGDVVVVAGGDGSLNHVVNALRGRLDGMTFALLPAGTGNDLARTLEIPLDARAAAEQAAQWKPRALDVGRARGGGIDRLFVNACVGGFAVEVDEVVSDDLKRLVGPAAYWVAAAKVLADLPRFDVWLNEVRVEECVAVGVGNGRMAGGGVKMWPGANPSDGILDGCALSVTGAGDLAKVAVALKTIGAERTGTARVVRAISVEVRADPVVEFNVDGELPGLHTPAAFEVAGSLTVLAPP
jgi:diacylglycerol kinase (ATP)